ncbi:MAG: hypothetical protein KGI75_08910, partial [Rhizobiaceae bacterium]|nr:hypothetical protein [Rhizobiaceae bacterium]
SSFSEDGKMCVFGVLGAEAGGLSLEVANEILGFFQRCIDDLTTRIGGKDAQAKAFQIMAALEGGVILAGIYKDVRAFDQSVAALVA